MSRTRHHGDKALQRKHGANWHWWRNEPKWWRKIAKHRPQRQAARQAQHEVMKGGDPLWPLDKKPWEYYW